MPKSSTSVEIRKEQPQDEPLVRRINELAFERPDEADLVDALRVHDRVALSLLAVGGTGAVGHLMLTSATIDSGEGRVPCLALAPMAVVPEFQRHGIGTQLVEHALHWAHGEGHHIVVVLGHPRYYPRFGFAPAAAHGIQCPYDVPDEVFLVAGLTPGALNDVTGRVCYAPEFPR